MRESKVYQLLTRWGLSTLLSTLLFAGCLTSGSVFAVPDSIYEPLQHWNGKKVYLSPARHSDGGRRGECRSTNETSAAWRSAYYAANGNYFVDKWNSTSSYRNLRARGYKVRIGRGTVSSAIANSNVWGAHVHIPIHSNAHVYGDCGASNISRFGTVVIYKSFGTSGGEGLSGHLKTTMGVVSPGTGDLICHNSSACTRINCLGELCSTVAKAAYLEREYHSWNTGANWIKNDHLYAWRIGWAVDRFLGYPR